MITQDWQFDYSKGTGIAPFMAGTRYPCSRAVSRTVNTGVILDTREHGPSRSAVAMVNDIIIIFYLQGGCAK